MGIKWKERTRHMEPRIYQVEQEQQALKKRLESLEKTVQGSDFLLRDMAHKQTMAMGIAMTTSEELRDFKLAMQERLTRLNDRVTDAHKELAELTITVNRIESIHGDILNQHTELLKQILDRLK